MVLHGGSAEVTCLAVHHGRALLAAGSADGAVRLFSLTSGDLRVTLTGHRAAVSAVSFDQHGMRLVSGGKVSAVEARQLFVVLCCVWLMIGHFSPD